MSEKKIIDFIRITKDKPLYFEHPDLFTETGLSDEEIRNALNTLYEQGMIQMSSFQSRVTLHPNVKLILEKHPGLSYEGILEIWNDPEKIAELWEDE